MRVVALGGIGGPAATACQPRAGSAPPLASESRTLEPLTAGPIRNPPDQQGTLSRTPLALPKVNRN